MDYEKDSHCTYCGHPFAPGAAWPRRCPECAQISYRNPLPVSVILLPVGASLLAVRRAHDPGRGKLALPGGFIERSESWQEAGARELYEETGIRLDPAEISLFRTHSAPDGTLLIFGLAPPRAASSLPPFQPTAESSERVLLPGPVELAFSLHTSVVRDYFTTTTPPPLSWLDWSRRLQALAQTGLAYTENVFDRERYEAIRQIAAEIMAAPTGMKVEAITDLFAEEMGYATPKVGVRAAVFGEEGEDPAILLVKEKRDGRWTLPGGWVDIGDSPAEAVERETWEEAGLRVQAQRLVAVYDPRKQGMAPPRPFTLIRLFFLCQRTSGSLHAGLETDAAAFFPLSSLPPLSTQRVTAHQIARMFDYYHNPDAPADFD